MCGANSLMNKISAVVPTYNRTATLLATLQSLNQQTLRGFEVIVVNDGGEDPQLNPGDYHFPLVYHEQENSGPAAARNKGAELATGDVLLFIGDDTLADRNLVWRHFYNHSRTDGQKTVQGYTQWHPSVADEFHLFLTDVSGIQGNYNILRDGDGWRYEINPAFCLTTNWSISTDAFEAIGGFDERFKEAAWEDIDIGYRLSRENVRAFFDPGAINYHLHRYDIDGFVRRQLKVGQWHHRICLSHPEMAGDQISPYALRESRKADLGQLASRTKELLYTTGEDVQQQKYERWQQLFFVAEQKGILGAIDADLYHPVLKAIEHVHSPEEIYFIYRCAAAIENGDLSYAMHNAEYLLEKNDDNWASHCVSGEVSLESGDRYGAMKFFERALVRAPGEKWARERFEELGK